MLSDDIQKTRDFYCDVLGMARRLPAASSISPGIGSMSATRRASTSPSGRATPRGRRKSAFRSRRKPPATGPVDHIAFNGTGFAEMRARLVERGLHVQRELARRHRLQANVLTRPERRPIEINFRSEESMTENGSEDHGLRIHRRRPHGRAHGAALAQGGHQPHGVRHVEGRHSPSSRRTARKSRARRSRSRTTPRSRS